MKLKIQWKENKSKMEMIIVSIGLVLILPPVMALRSRE